MRTLSPGSDFFKEPQGGATLSECTLQATLVLSLAPINSEDDFFFLEGFFLAFSGWAEHLGCSVHLEERQFCPHHPFVFEADVTRPAKMAGWRRT